MGDGDGEVGGEVYSRVKVCSAEVVSTGPEAETWTEVVVVWIFVAATP